MPEWTVDTLKEYVDAELRHLSTVFTQFASSHTQIHNAEVEANRRMAFEMDKKLDETSEVLARIQGQLLRSLPRESFDEEHKQLEQKVDDLIHWRFTIAGRTAVLIALVGILAGLGGVLIGHLLGA